MIRLGKFCTEAQKKELLGLLRTAQSTPVMKLSTNSPSFAETACRREACHKYALGAGLPEIEGFYGCDLATGEFVK